MRSLVDWGFGVGTAASAQALFTRGFVAPQQSACRTQIPCNYINRFCGRGSKRRRRAFETERAAFAVSVAAASREGCGFGEADGVIVGWNGRRRTAWMPEAPARNGNGIAERTARSTFNQLALGFWEARARGCEHKTLQNIIVIMMFGPGRAGRTRLP